MSQPLSWEYLACDFHGLLAAAKASAEAAGVTVPEYPDPLETITRGMDSFGEDGWELVAVQGNDDATYIFKRPKQ